MAQGPEARMEAWASTRRAGATVYVLKVMLRYSLPMFIMTVLIQWAFSHSNPFSGASLIGLVIFFFWGLILGVYWWDTNETAFNEWQNRPGA